VFRVPITGDRSAAATSASLYSSLPRIAWMRNVSAWSAAAMSRSTKRWRCGPAAIRPSAAKANELLATTELGIKIDGYVALEQIAELLRSRGPGDVRDSA
jgi:hypothetical protein